VPLALSFVVSQVGTGSCQPLKDAMIDVWHCDASGVYSDVQGSVGTKFLRGYQMSDANGKAAFTTIYPGWYQGRAVHIHFKIRRPTANSQIYDFTSQLFFDEALTKQIYAQQPYALHGLPDTSNGADGIYQGGGSQLLISPAKSGDGYAVTFSIGLDLGTA
jgi:protocatechuate 3,4-dioxygenase beta subunit